MQKSSSDGGTATSVAKEPKATNIEFVEDAMVLTLEDSRTLAVPLEWFPSLRDASDEDRRNCLDGCSSRRSHGDRTDAGCRQRGGKTPRQVTAQLP